MKKNKGIMGNLNKSSWFGNFKSLSLATLLILKKTKLVIINYEKLEIKKNKPLFKQKNLCFKKEDIIFENLDFYEILGEGAFSEVFICKINNKDIYAIKCMNKNNIIKNNAKQQISNEIELLKQINNHNNFIVKFINKLEDNINIYLLLEYIEGREFFDYLCSRNALNEIETKFYISNIIIAIEYLHSQNIIFRDLKPENIIISKNGYLKLIDFGFAKKLNDNELTYTLCGTPDYLAPEVISGKGYGKSVDFWTIGILTYELLHSKTPYINNDNLYNFYNTITNERLKFNDDVSSNFQNFISSLLFINPKKRIGSFNGITDIKEHILFNNYKWDYINNMRIKAPYIPEILPTIDSKYKKSYKEFID